MTDVFISYKRQDRDKARSIAVAFATRGLDVWWDVELLPGDIFAEVINKVIVRAKAVVVLWTPDSINSRWVLSETALGLENRKLVPVMLVETNIPVPYNTLHTLNLSTWDGSSDHPLLNDLFLGVTKITSVNVLNTKHRSENEVKIVLSKPAHEVEFWRAVSSHSSESEKEYQTYLDRYGNTGAFSELAKIRISELDKSNSAKELIRWPRTTAALGTGGVCLILFTQYIPELMEPNSSNVTTLSDSFNEPEKTVEIPDINAARRILRATSDTLVLVDGGTLHDVSPIGFPNSGYFDLEVNQSEHVYASARVMFKEPIAPNYFITARAGFGPGLGTIELKGRDVWFVLNSDLRQYLIYSSEEHHTSWQMLPVPANSSGWNTLGMHHDGRFVNVFLNSEFVASFRLWGQPSEGPVGMFFKANPKGGDASIQRLAVYEF